MTTAEEMEDDYNEYDEFDEDEDEGTLSGFAVLLIGLVMFGAFIAVTYLAYHQGIKRGQNDRVETPYVAADPEPMKIETADKGETTPDREVYDAYDGTKSDTLTVLTEGPEEPVNRDSNDAIASIAADSSDAVQNAGGEAKDRIASLQQEDAAAFDAPAEEEPEPAAATAPTPVNATSTAAVSALSGTHLVQVGAFRSDDEAKAQWGRLESRLGDYVDGKTYDIERADLGDRGVYHRLRIGPFASADAAKDYCVGLKQRGQDCLVKAK